MLSGENYAYMFPVIYDYNAIRFKAFVQAVPRVITAMTRQTPQKNRGEFLFGKQLELQPNSHVIERNRRAPRKLDYPDDPVSSPICRIALHLQ